MGFFGDAPVDDRNKSVIAFYEERQNMLALEYMEFYTNSQTAPIELLRLVKEVDVHIKALKTQNPEGNPDDAEFEFLGRWTDDFDAAMAKADEAKEAIALRHISQSLAEIRKFVKRSETSLPELKEMQRSAFRSSNNSQLKQIAFESATILDSLLVAKDWVTEATTTIKDIGYLGTTLRTQAVQHGWKNPNSYMVEVKSKRVGKVLGSLEKLNKLVAIWQIGDGAKAFFGGGKTAMDTALSGVSFSATIASAGGTLLGASGFFGLYNNLYIGPMVGKIVGQIEVLKDIISTHQNRPFMQWGQTDKGKLDMVNWDIEPGGREMYEYMLKVVKAPSAKSLPTMPASVRKYISKYSDDFDSGIKGTDFDGNPYTPRIKVNYDDIDDKAVWLFNHREDVWAMLYGNLKV